MGPLFENSFPTLDDACFTHMMVPVCGIFKYITVWTSQWIQADEYVISPSCHSMFHKTITTGRCTRFTSWEYIEILKSRRSLTVVAGMKNEWSRRTDKKLNAKKPPPTSATSCTVSSSIVDISTKHFPVVMPCKTPVLVLNTICERALFNNNSVNKDKERVSKTSKKYNYTVKLS